MSDGEEVLPNGWEFTSIGDVTHAKVDQIERSGPLTYIDIGAVDNQSKSIDEPNRLGKNDKIPSRARQVVATNDVLVSMTRPNLNAVAIVPQQFDNSIASTGFDVLRPIEVEPRWLFNIVKSNHFIESMSEIVQGALYPAVRPSDIREFKIPVPPLAEQRRIVAKIEALQERSRKAREALAEVGPLLEQFRQSLLAAAFRGDLTANWRAANPNVEPASELLNRIRQERRQKWEQLEIAKYKAKGKQPPTGWQTAYQEPEPINGTGLPALPKSWCWTRAEEVCAYITKGTTPAKESMTQDNGEVRFLKVGNLTFSGALDFSKENAYINSGTHNSGVYARSRVYPGDVLMNLVGPPLGKVSVIPTDLEHSNVNQAIAIFRPLEGLNSSYLTMVLTTPSILDRIISRAKQTSGQRNLTLDLARGLPIPLAPLAEQAELARRLEQSLSSIENLETDFASSEVELTQLNQSILAKAFRGELVLQDPNDEPASELLARIRADREAAGSAKSPKATKPRKQRAAAK